MTDHHLLIVGHWPNADADTAWYRLQQMMGWPGAGVPGELVVLGSSMTTLHIGADSLTRHVVPNFENVVLLGAPLAYAFGALTVPPFTWAETAWHPSVGRCWFPPQRSAMWQSGTHRAQARNFWLNFFKVAGQAA